MKRLVRSAVGTIMRHSPQGVKSIILEECFNSFGMVEISKRVFPNLGISEVGVWGDLGLIRSAWNDRVILQMYAQAGRTESSVVDVINGFFGNGPGTYMDIGANIGLTTIPIARNPGIRCLAFEPEPVNFRFLKINVEANVPNNKVEFFQNAIYHSRSSVSLAVADGNLGDHRLTNKGIPGRPIVEVAAFPLDDVLDKITGKLAVKVDTQGAEPFVVAGGRQTMARAGLLIMEFCPYLMKQLGGSADVVIDLMGSFDEVALLEPASTSFPAFGSAIAAQERLYATVRTARDTGDDYLDIVARRTAEGQ